MNRTARSLAVAAVASLAFAAPAIHAETNPDGNRVVMKKHDADKDGMISKAEAMKMVEAMFDRTDTKKKGKLDQKQFEAFLEALMRDSLGG